MAFFYYIALYIITAVFFSFVYLFNSENVSTSMEISDFGIEDALHFSFTTQSTLGYGDMAPIDGLRFATAIQSTLGICLHGLAFGLIVFHLIRGRPSIKFPLNACYDPTQHTFVFRVLNENYDELAEMEIRIFASQTLSIEDDPLIRRRQFELALQHRVLPLIPGLGYSDERPRGAGVVALRSASNGGEPSLVLSTQVSELKIASPLSLGVGDRISVYVKGTSVSTGNTIYKIQSYFVDDITCGIYKDMEQDYHEDFDEARQLYREGKTRLRRKLFDEIIEQEEEYCCQCVFHANCPLGLARQTREKKN